MLIDCRFIFLKLASLICMYKLSPPQMLSVWWGKKSRDRKHFRKDRTVVYMFGLEYF